MSAEECPHKDKPWRCIPCCISALWRDVPRLERAIRNQERAGNDGPRPGFGSREPINLAAYALLQDLGRHGGVGGLDNALHTLRDPARLNELRRRTRQYRSRASLILHEALAPYPLRWPVDQPDGTCKDEDVPCPVIDDEGTCGGQLLIHRNTDSTSGTYGKPLTIVCRYDDTHEWAAGLGWLRLGVLLGGRLDLAS